METTSMYDCLTSERLWDSQKTARLLPSLWEGLGEGLAAAKTKLISLRAGFQSARRLLLGISDR
jgi:hypothetical protein